MNDTAYQPQSRSTAWITIDDHRLRPICSNQSVQHDSMIRHELNGGVFLNWNGNQDSLYLEGTPAGVEGWRNIIIQDQLRETLEEDGETLRCPQHGEAEWLTFWEAMDNWRDNNEANGFYQCQYCSEWAEEGEHDLDDEWLCANCRDRGRGRFESDDYHSWDERESSQYARLSETRRWQHVLPPIR